MIKLENEIRLVIKGRGEINLLSEKYYDVPFTVYVNEELRENYSKIYSLNESSELNNVTLKFEKVITSCENMFYDLKNIVEVDLSKFNTSNMLNMYYMFFNCTNLKKITFGEFDTSKVIDMFRLFYNCSSLESIDLSHFNTSSVTTMNAMFSGCEKLKSIDASKFDTSKVVDMYDIFAYCYNVEYVDVSNFDTSKVTDMQGIFYCCHKLTSLDLHNFDASSLLKFPYSFYYLNSLKYLNLESFSINENVSLVEVFANLPKDINIILNDLRIKNFLLETMNKSKSNNYFEKGLIIQNKCLNLSGEYKYKYNFFCLKDCPNDTFIVEDYEYICFDKIPENYYLDTKSNKYKECFDKCSKCKQSGNDNNNNCDSCINNYTFINDSNAIQNNCYESCNYYYYFNNTKNYKCTESDSCPNKYKLIKEKKKCIDDCSNDDIYIFEYNNECFEQYPTTTTTVISSEISFTEEKESNTLEIYQHYKNLGEYIEKGLMDDIIKNVTLKKEDYIERYGNLTYQITTSENQKNKTKTNLSTINLKDCETTLRNVYGINESFPLNILKVEYKVENLLIPMIGYEIYNPLDNSKLNLSYCKGTISLDIPVTINEDKLFIYDPDSDYYTDNCFSYTTDNETDIILNDRKQEFIDNNLSLCENNCAYINYDKDTKQSACDCYIKVTMDIKSDLIENENKLSNNISLEEDSFLSSNLLSLKCTNQLFSKDGLKNNISSYIIAFFIFFFVLSILIFIKCGYSILDGKISNIIDLKSKEENEKEKNYNKKNSKKNLVDIHKVKKKSKKKFFNKHKIGYPPRKINIKIVNKLNMNRNESTIKKMNINSSLGMNQRMLGYNLKTKNKVKHGKNNFNIFELNNLSYKDAIIYDKRACCDYYFSLLRTKHPILFSLIPLDDYNLTTIKLCILFFSFSIHYAINFAFFVDKTMHKIYSDKGKYDLIYFIPKISISFIISHIVCIIIKYIFLSERNLFQIRKQPNVNEAELKATKERRNLIIKYIIFFILGISSLSLFWMILSSFGAVYKNTQVIVFENTLFSFGMSLIYPFIINIFPCMFRINSLKSKTKNEEYKYKCSQFLQLL